MREAIIFDLDGTLIHSEPLGMQVVESYFGGLDAEDYRSVTGVKWRVAIDYLCKKTQTKTSPDSVEQEIMKRYRSILFEQIPWIEGAREVVRQLSKDFRLAVVTGSDRQDLERVVEAGNITNCFEQLIGAEDYRESKPSPEGYQLALSRMGLSPDQAIVFEDSTAGIESAAAAGVAVVRVSSAEVTEEAHSKCVGMISNWVGVDREWILQKSSSVRR